MPGASNPMRTGPPLATFDVPTRPSGAISSPVTDQRSPSDTTPRSGAHRKQRHPRARRRVEGELGRAEETQVAAADQDDRPRAVPHQRVHRGEVMVDAAAEKTETEDQRRRDRTQAFLQVGAVLLGDLVERHAPRAQRVGVAQRVHVADHRRKSAPAGQDHVAAAVRRHRHRRDRQRRGELVRVDRPAADQRDRPGRPDERRGHCQGWIATAEMLFCGEPSISRSE